MGCTGSKTGVSKTGPKTLLTDSTHEEKQPGMPKLSCFWPVEHDATDEQLSSFVASLSTEDRQRIEFFLDPSNVFWFYLPNGVDVEVQNALAGLSPEVRQKLKHLLLPVEMTQAQLVQASAVIEDDDVKPLKQLRFEAKVEQVKESDVRLEEADAVVGTAGFFSCAPCRVCRSA